MPFACISLVSKKESLSCEEFKHRYENGFVPLMKEVCGPLFPKTWVRRYIARDASEDQRKAGPMGLPTLLVGRNEDIGWDAMSEFTFKDELHFQQFFALINEEGPAERLLAEERSFSDIAKLKLIVMERWEDRGEE